jgi:hypothetical protein
MRRAVRIQSREQCPEALGVVQLTGMAELMKEHMIDQLGLEEQQPQIEGDASARCATPPARTLVSDGHALKAEAVPAKKK